MGEVVLFQIWLIIILLMLVAGVVFRVWPRSLPAVQMSKVAPKAASQLVGEFIEGSYEGQFGYPSGLFHVETSAEGRVVAREIVGRGSHFTQILKGLYRAVLRVGAGFGCIGAAIALFLAVILTPALIYAAVAEVLLKYLLRSQIVTSLERVQDGTKVAFTLRGPVALLIGRRLERAFHAPVLPLRVAALAGVASPPGRGSSAPGGYGEGASGEAGQDPASTVIDAGPA